MKKKTIKTGIKYFISIFIIILIISGIVIHVKSDNIGSINPYIDNEISSAVKRIKDNQNKNTISIGFITDIHINELEEDIYMNNIKAFTNISNSGLLDLSISGGDLFYGTWQNRNEGKVNLKYSKLLFDNIKIPMFYIRGNHDCNIKTNADEAISNEDYYNIMLKQLEGKVIFNSDEPYGGYYYTDLEDQKVRVCFLNAFNGENYQYIFGEKQLEFIAKDMLNFKNKSNSQEWQVIFFTHTVESSQFHADSVEDKDKFFEILSAYENATTLTLNNEEISYASQKNGTIIAIVTGHHHADLIDEQNEFSIVTTRSASVIYDRNYADEHIYYDAFGTKDELAFDIFTIDTVKRTINITRVGRGEDRYLNY